MVYAAVLAGGSGLRMGGSLPKQFMTLEGKPIIIRSIEAFLNCEMVSKIYVAVSSDYVEYTKKLISEYISHEEIYVVIGGENRNATLFNVLKRIEDDFGISDSDIILTHDSVRPFIDNRIIKDNIVAAEKYGACNTVVPAVDTILQSSDGKFIDDVPARQTMFHAQTPQSFRIGKLMEFYKGMSSEDFENFTDACTVFIKNGEKVFMVNGSRENIKLTYPEDMEKATVIIKNREA